MLKRRSLGRDLEQHDSQRQHLLADIELVLRNANVFHEVVGNRVRNVAAVQLKTEEAKSQQWHDDQVKSEKHRSAPVDVMAASYALPLRSHFLLLGPISLCINFIALAATAIGDFVRVGVLDIEFRHRQRRSFLRLKMQCRNNAPTWMGASYVLYKR